MTVSVLGTDYEIIRKKYDDDPDFKDRSIDGYCDGIYHKIVYCDMTTFPGMEKEPEDRCRLIEKATLRHEIVHAFFNESGLKDSAFMVEQSWAKNEEMIDWVALQGPKLYEAWKSVDAV